MASVLRSTGCAFRGSKHFGERVHHHLQVRDSMFARKTVLHTSTSLCNSGTSTPVRHASSERVNKVSFLIQLTRQQSSKASVETL